MRRILLVDDNELFSVALQKYLQATSIYTVTRATDGQQAVKIFATQTFDLIISDIKMPQMNGLEFLKSVRSHSNIPFILITGFSEIVETQEAYEMGANEFIPKPFRTEEIIQAIQRCLNDEPTHRPAEIRYCKIGIDDFISGRQIKFNVFAQLSENKYVKIAHKGEDLSPARIKAFKEKGVFFLYLKQEDFRQYVGFNVDLVSAVKNSDQIHLEKKFHLLRHTGEILQSEILRSGIDPSLYDAAAAFVETTVDVVTDNVDALQLLDSLNQHVDHIYTHSVGVSLFSTMIALHLDWNLPTNRFKVAMGGLLHDIGHKEIQKSILERSRVTWSVEDVQKYESHPVRGQEILSMLRHIPQDVLQIVQQHHEDCESRGFPLKLTKSGIHPMAKLIMVADEFCYRTIRNPNYKSMAAADALQDMVLYCSSRVDRQAFDSLIRLFNLNPPARPAN